MTSGSKFLLNNSHLLYQLIKLVIHILRAPLHELFDSFISIRVPLNRSHRHLLVSLVLSKHLKADTKTLRLCIMKQEFTEVHVASTCANEHTPTFDLD